MAQTDNAIRALMGTAYQRVAQWLAPNATGTTPTELLDPVLPGEEAIPDAIIRLPNQQLLHIEFQGYKDPNMAARMHRYNQRIADRKASAARCTGLLRSALPRPAGRGGWQ